MTKLDTHVVHHAHHTTDASLEFRNLAPLRPVRKDASAFAVKNMHLAIQKCQPGKVQQCASYGALRLLPSLRKQVVLPDSSLINVSHSDHQGEEAEREI